MSSEIKICQNCRREFAVEPEDFDFYKKISVPPPTSCPECRLKRRLVWFNLSNLYKRKCDLCGEEKISMYPPEAPYRVYCFKCWWSDNWDPLKYGRDYDFSRPFFEQFNELLHETPLLGLSLDFFTGETVSFNNYVGHLKNCYLLFWADFNEDCHHGFYLYQNKNLLDCSLLMFCESSYDLTHAYKTNRCFSSRDIHESIDCYFMKDSRNCQNCFASANLRNKKYHIFNKPYAKEDYFKEIKKWDLGSYRTYEEIKKLAGEHWKKFPPQPIFDDFAINCTGNRIYNSKNCKECFEIQETENSKHLLIMIDPTTEDCYDVSGWGENLALSYDSGVVGGDSSEIKFCHDSGINLYHAEYCKDSYGGNHQFGCVSVKKAKHCILNKLYTEGEFSELREKIIKHMDEMPYKDKQGRTYRYGEFFPPDLSPHAYNETMALKFFPVSRDEAVSENYRWREPDVREYAVTKKAADLPDHIKDADNGILREIIGCIACSRGFKMTGFEINFLRKMNLPLPRKCPFCRIGEKIDLWVKGSKLVKRTCGKCGTEFETPHREEEVKYILCKKCYLEEVV